MAVDPCRKTKGSIVSPLLQLQSRISTLLIGDIAEVIFNVTEFSSSTISVVATVSNPELLNGTAMSYGGQSLTIEVPGGSKLLLVVQLKSTL